MVDTKKNVCTVVFSGRDAVLQKSFSNIPGVYTAALESFSVTDALRARNILFMDPVKTVEYLKQHGERFIQQNQ